MAGTVPATKPKRISSSFSPIGVLEADVLAIVSEQGRAAVRDMYETLRRRAVHITCVTAMNNRLIDEIVARLWGGDRGPALAHLLGLRQPLRKRQITELRRRAEKRFGSSTQGWLRGSWRGDAPAIAGLPRRPATTVRGPCD